MSNTGFTIAIIKQDLHKVVWVVKVMQSPRDKDSEFESFVFWIFMHDSSD